ncbi:fasciclin domain-containing protein [Halovulum dunhuangense]|uniref:Fasciclin domain-containing protein n=1 Tax=Halovulum dunhuangense TaxID=1505036 RepID=A0A849KYR0_9RHOB|nr:fasciclin domain-containing protein [Halovulum dunhuangense]NNU79426.1 fasciclin domain-containing protein [Halovulum dunhuangense]
MTLKHKIAVAALAALVAGAAQAQMMRNPDVGGAPMFADRNIVENAVNSADHTTLVAAVQAAELVDTLANGGPFTVFAPVNAAFAALPDGTVETLLEPENRGQLTKVLTAHVVEGTLTRASIDEALAAGGGRTELVTVSGDALAVEKRGNTYYVIDENANGARVTIADVMQSNGVIHVVDKVLLPR